MSSCVSRWYQYFYRVNEETKAQRKKPQSCTELVAVLGVWSLVLIIASLWDFVCI